MQVFQCVSENSLPFIASAEYEETYHHSLTSLQVFKKAFNVLLHVKSCQHHWQAVKMNMKELYFSGCD